MQSSGRACSRDRAALALILGFSLVTKLGLAFLVWFRNRAAIWHPDSASYHNLALNMLRHCVFSRSSGPPFVYESFRTPGYPLALSGVYALSGDSALPVIGLQAVTATGTVALTWLLGRRLFDSRVGMWAAALLSLDVASISSSQLLMSETTFTLLVLTAVWLLVRSLSPLRGWAGFALSGLALACAIQVRPIGYYLAPLGAAGIAAFLVLKDRATTTTHVRWRLALTRAGSFPLAPALLVGGWQMNNLRKTGSARFSHIEGLNMYFYRAAGAISMRDHKPLFQVHHEMGLETERTDFTGWVAKRPEFAGRNHAALGEQWFRDGIAIIVRNPGWLVLMHLRSTAALLLDPGTFCLAVLAGLETDQRGQELLARLQTAPGSFMAEVWSAHRFLFLSSIFGLAFLVVLYSGVVLWLVRAPRSTWAPGVVVVVAVLVYFTLISAGPEAASRFRVPLAPLLALLSAAGWQSLRKSR
ncbi:MAG: glycosyltransferase family 39 protein [candidate division WOR-3 bacterium]|nr:glycosyltransferase family 39 protein [candidate division WOR-3 bacterium]